MTSSPAQAPEPVRPRSAHQTGPAGAVGVPSTDEIGDSVRAAVLALPGVADLHTGAFGEVATYLPGRRVEGVRVRADRTEVHIVVEWGASALEVADAVRAAATAITHTVVDVHVQDFAAPMSDDPSSDDPSSDDPSSDDPSSDDPSSDDPSSDDPSQGRPSGPPQGAPLPERQG